MVEKIKERSEPEHKDYLERDQIQMDKIFQRRDRDEHGRNDQKSMVDNGRTTREGLDSRRKLRWKDRKQPTCRSSTTEESIGRVQRSDDEENKKNDIDNLGGWM